jgi:hypothetical protein
VDAHKKDLFIAMLIGDQTTPVSWTVPYEPNAVRRLVRKLERDAPGPVQRWYEAGPCGDALQRHATTARVRAVQSSRRRSCRRRLATGFRPIVAMRANWRSGCAPGC